MLVPKKGLEAQKINMELYCTLGYKLHQYCRQGLCMVFKTSPPSRGGGGFVLLLYFYQDISSLVGRQWSESWGRMPVVRNFFLLLISPRAGRIFPPKSLTRDRWSCCCCQEEEEERRHGRYSHPLSSSHLYTKVHLSRLSGGSFQIKKISDMKTLLPLALVGEFSSCGRNQLSGQVQRMCCVTCFTCQGSQVQLPPATQMLWLVTHSCNPAWLTLQMGLPVH